MDTEEFVRGIKASCSDTLAESEIKSFKNPPGRRPNTRLLRLFKWFQQLNPGDQAMLAEAMKVTAEDAIFGFFCVLDGVRVIENGEDKGNFELFYVKGDERVLLNPSGDDLHDIFQSMRNFE